MGRFCDGYVVYRLSRWVGEELVVRAMRYNQQKSSIGEANSLGFLHL